MKSKIFAEKENTNAHRLAEHTNVAVANNFVEHWGSQIVSQN